jgi:ribosomal protein S12 methylthiotransferase
MGQRFWVETLGCPKNQVDSDKLAGALAADGLEPADGPGGADLIVVNTCAFVEEARRESIDAVLALAGHRERGARLVVTGCMAERYGEELAEALPEADQVVGFGVPVSLGPRRSPEAPPLPPLDLLNLPRPPASAPWAYVKVAEGCDRACGFCAIPSFRGPQRSRAIEAVLAEVESLAAGGGPGGVPVREVVLVAQDLAAYGRDQGRGERRIVPLAAAVAERVPWVRLLYLYPADLTDQLTELVGTGPVPYFDLSLQHVSAPLLRRMRRWGDGERYLERIAAIRALRPDAAFRSNFIVGYPGETEEDHDELLRFVAEAELDWCGVFPYSAEEGTHAAGLEGVVPPALVAERRAELAELTESITTRRRAALVGTEVEVLVEEAGIARSFREAPEIDGVVEVPEDLAVGEFHRVRIVDAAGPDLVAEAAPVGPSEA